MKSCEPGFSIVKYKHLMKIITYNVNGLRAAVSKVLPWLAGTKQPDVLCLQETKYSQNNIRWSFWGALWEYKGYLYSAQRLPSGVAIALPSWARCCRHRWGDNVRRFWLRAILVICQLWCMSCRTVSDERQAFKWWLEAFRYVTGTRVPSQFDSLRVVQYLSWLDNSIVCHM